MNKRKQNEADTWRQTAWRGGLSMLVPLHSWGPVRSSCSEYSWAGEQGWPSLDSELRPKRLSSYALHLSDICHCNHKGPRFTSPLTDWSFHSFVGLCAHSGMFLSTYWVTRFMSSPMSFPPYPSFSYFPLYCVILSMSDRQGKMFFNSYFSLDRLESRLGEGGSGAWFYDRA